VSVEHVADILSCVLKDNKTKGVMLLIHT